MRRPVRNPPSRETTALMSSSVCSEPFMSIWTSPLRAISTARMAAIAAIVDVNDLNGSQVELQGAATLRIVASEPTRTGTINLSLNAWIAPPRDTSSHGQTIAVLTAVLEVARAIKPR